MNYVVYGPYPPMPGEASAAVFAFVRELVDGGHTVRVVSPVPSAAHAHADIGGARGAARLGRLLAGADRLVARIDGVGLAIDREALALVPGRMALALALRRVPDVRLELERVPASVHPRWAAWVGSTAGTLVVTEEQARAALVAAGVDPARVVVDAGLVARAGEARAAGRGQPRWRLSESPSRVEVQAAVRARAAASRTATASVGPATTGSASRPLRLVAPLGFPPIKSRNPVFGTVKKVLRRLFAWQLEPIVQHVNQLHTASIEAVDGAAGQPASPSD